MERIFPGDSELAFRMRGFDWSSLRDAYAQMYRDVSERPVMRKDPLPHLRDGADPVTA